MPFRLSISLKYLYRVVSKLRTIRLSLCSKTNELSCKPKCSVMTNTYNFEHIINGGSFNWQLKQDIDIV